MGCQGDLLTGTGLLNRVEFGLNSVNGWGPVGEEGEKVPGPSEGLAF